MGKSVAGPIIGIIGASMLCVAGVILILGMTAINALIMSSGGSTLSVDLTMYYVNMIMTLALGILALVGAIVGFKKGLPGGIILLIAGGVALVGSFIPLGIISFSSGTTTYYAAVTLTSPLIFIVDPALIVLGGILSLALKED